MSIVSPQIRIARFIKGFLTYVRQDYLDKITTPNDSLLYRMFAGSDVWDKYNTKTEGSALFSFGKEHPRYVDLRLGYDEKRLKEPTIHVTMGSENEEFQGVGLSTEWADTSTPEQTRLRIFNHNCRIVFTSSNSMEVEMMYVVVKKILTIFADRLELQGIGPIRISGSDIQIKPGEIPNYFSRELIIQSKYEDETTYLLPYEWANITNIIANGKATTI